MIFPKLKINIYLFLVFCLVLVPSESLAAKLYLEPSSGEYQKGDVFIEEVRIDVDNEWINTVKTDIFFSQESLEVVDFIKGGSILSLWIEEPSFEEESGLISFSGGIPGGYKGKIIGDPGTSNLILKIAFKVKDLSEDRKGYISFSDTSQVYLNDHKGSLADLKKEGSSLDFVLGEEREDEWQEMLERDKVSPEPFVLEIRKDEDIFEGRYFLVFSTTDKQTGIDHFEIKEGEKEWKKGKSPYLLEDQELESLIKVKAIDKAGNERISEASPFKALPEKKEKSFYLPVLIIIALILFLVWIFKKLKKKK